MNGKLTKYGRILRVFLIVMWVLMISFPIYWTVLTSFKLQVDIYEGPYFLPGVDFKPTTAAWNYLLVENRGMFFLSLKNSLLISAVSSVLALAVGALAAYGLSRYEYKYFFLGDSQGIAANILSQRMMPPIIAVLALFIMFKSLGLLDSVAGLIIIYTWMNLPVTVYLLKDFFAGIPRELEDAAAADGYSKWDQIRKIVLPLAAPGLATCFTLAFNFAWNEFLFSLILTFQKSVTLPVLISSMNAQMSPQWSIISALGVVAMVPPAVIAVVMDRYLVQGLSFGSAGR